MKNIKEYLPSGEDFGDVDYWEIRLETEKTMSIQIKDSEVEAVSELDADRGSVRVLYNGGWGFSAFNDLETVKDHVKRAVDYAKSVGGGDSRVKTLGPVEAKITTDCEKHPNNVPFEDKLKLAKVYEEQIRANEQVEMSTVLYSDVMRDKVFLNSEDRFIEHDEVYVRGALVGTGLVEGVPETTSEGIRHRGGFERFEKLGDKMPDLFSDLDILLKAEDAKGGTYDCVIDPMMTGVFIHEAFGHTSEADSFYRDMGQREVMRLGRQIGSDILTVIDDASLADFSCGSYSYDDEGVEGKRTVLIDKGILTAHLHNRSTAAEMDEELTGNARALNAGYIPIVRMTNTVIEPGDLSYEDLLKELGNGLFVKGSRGGNGGEEFTFNAMLGFIVENGEITRPVKNFTLTGNLFTTLKNISAVSDAQTILSSAGGCGKDGQMPLAVGFGGPYILLKSALIGGR